MDVYVQPTIVGISQQISQACKQMKHAENKQRARNEIWTEDKQSSLYY